VPLTPQFYGKKEPNFFDRRYVWPYKGLIVGTDPVAVDAIGASHCFRQSGSPFLVKTGLWMFLPHISWWLIKHIGVGISDLSRIQLIKLGWPTNY